MTERPQFVDNRDDNTLTAAINSYLSGLGVELRDSPDLDVVTGYFNPRGYFSVREGLSEVGDVRLLIGAQPNDEGREEWRQPGDPLDDEQYSQERVDEVLQSLDDDLAQDRDLLGFSENVDEGLRELVDWLRSDNVEVRRHEKGFVHGKAYLFDDGRQGVVAGSSNFTGAGLNSNLELNLGAYQPQVTDEVAEWFKTLWEESEPYDLAGLYEERFEPFNPYLIYLRVLYERYGTELEAEGEDDDGEIELANFQEDGKRRAQRFLEERGGVIVADEVGLGKTYIGGKLLEQTVQQNRQRALVVAPAYLRDGMWTSVRSEWNFYYEVISYAELRNEIQLGGDTAYLDQPVNDYQMVVLDEAHAFRNPNTQQSQALRQLLRGTPPKDVVMLTATPVNNSLWDLYYLLRYFIKNDATFADDGIRSLRDRFKSAQSEDPSELNPESLFDVLDQTTVRRTRRFIKDNYDQARLPDGEGGYIYVDFPEQRPRRVDYDFDETFGDDFFQDIAEGLAAGEDIDESELKLARYRPSYYLEGEDDGSELSLVGLLRTGLLKRFESSSYAFANTLDRMVAQNEIALGLLEEGYAPDADAIDEWVEMDSDEGFKEAFDSINGKVNARQLTDEDEDPEQFRADLENDLEILRYWRERAAGVTRDEDEKLHALRDALHDIVSDARDDAQASTTEEATFEAAFCQNRKVLLFSYYKDTIQWVLDYLKEAVAEDDELSCYEGRIAAVTGDGSVDGVTRKDAVHGFAPNSTDAPEGSTDDYDILIATDVLGQGVNLQDARNVINYDLPWNPMRVVQRNGRIDRVNSPHDEIFPHCIFPEDRLDDLLGLEHRVRQKLTQAARTIGEDGSIFPDMETVNRNYSDKEADIEALQSEDPDAYEQGGREAAAYSGEEYRQELRNGLADHEERVTSLPWAAGSGMYGDHPGFFFCARIGEELYLRFVPAEYNESTKGEADEAGDEDDDPMIRDTLGCLKRIECDPGTERHLPDEARDGVYEAWEEARNDIFGQWQYQVDPRNVQPDVPKILREVEEHLAEHAPTNTDQEGAERTRKSVGAPLSRREQREFRKIHNDDGLGAVEKSNQFVEKVDELGLEPFESPDPKPRIRKEDVQLICWMVISEEETQEWGGLEGQATIGGSSDNR